MKGFVFLTIVVALSIMTVVLIKLYKRSKSNFPPARQGERIGIPDNISVVNPGGPSGAAPGPSGIVPVTQTQTVAGASGVELSIVSGGGGPGRQSAKYDKLPLVPNIEDGVVR